MTKRITLAVCAAAALFAASAALGAAADQRVFAIDAQNNSGVHGTITLTAMGQKTRVALALVGTAPGVPLPAHVHPGPCAKLDPKPAYPLSNVVDGVSVTDVNAPIDALEKPTMSINVHESAANIAHYIACGDL